MHKPYVFIGSSSEGLEIAQALQQGIRDTCESHVWHQGVFEPGQNTLETLVTSVTKYDFAILVFSPDDAINSRKVQSNAPRDNVLIELGLFVGVLGRQRTFVVFDRGGQLKIPTDLAGVTLLDYERPNKGNWQSALGPACASIRDAVRRQRKREYDKVEFPPLEAVPPADEIADRVAEQRMQTHEDILGAAAAPPGLDRWYAQLRPVIHQSASYTTPTYFLDTDLNILDWNIAFDLLFQEIAARLQYQHVNALIARLLNYDEVFTHARQFTEEVRKGYLPFVDTERLMYRSRRYGDVSFMKVATQLHTPAGELQGWSVALLPETIDWPLFCNDIEQRIHAEKMWSVYASAYDRILLQFPPYTQLLKDVGSVIPDVAGHVIDIGAGTGNSTKALLDRGFRVTSVEFSPTMIDCMRAKKFDATKHRIVKARAETIGELRSIEPESFDAATLVNVLYSVDQPLSCLTGVHRILRPGGVMGLSTTHSKVKLRPLLDSIRDHLEKNDALIANARAYNRLREINKEIERTIARRYSVEEYVEMVENAGFKILRCDEFTYEGAVMLLHARKLEE
jgi:ubiquinone/menaquinone biosynthesis C-methylase UbiE